MSLLFNMLSRLVITFLPRSKWSEVTQSCLTLCDPVDCSLPGSSIHGILQARIQEWLAISFSRGSSQPKDWTWVSHIADGCFNLWATREALPRSKRLLISWLQSPTAMILEPKKIKSVTVSTVSPSICHEVMGPDAMILVFWMLSFKPIFSLSSLNFIKRFFSSSSLSAIRVVSSAYLRLLIFLWAILITACASSSPACLMMYTLHITTLMYSSQFGTSLLFHVQF